VAYFKWPQSQAISQGTAYSIHQSCTPACYHSAYWSTCEVPVIHLQLLCGLLHVTQASTVATRNVVNVYKTPGQAASIWESNWQITRLQATGSILHSKRKCRRYMLILDKRGNIGTLRHCGLFTQPFCNGNITMQSVCVVELHAIVNYTQMLSDAQQYFYGKFMSLATMQILHTRFWKKLYSNTQFSQVTYKCYKATKKVCLLMAFLRCIVWLNIL